jgi:hypothetical protein
MYAGFALLETTKDIVFIETKKYVGPTTSPVFR